MTRQHLAVCLLTAFFLCALVLRTWLHRRRTGRWGLNGVSGPVGSPGFWGGVAFAGALGLSPLAVALPSRLAPLPGAGALLAVLGVALTVAAQAGLGPSWRVGVDPAERTALITRGLYAWVRNPIFTGMGSFAAGLAWLWPNAASALALLLTVVAFQLQVRWVEEPYLTRVHGDAYRRWASRVGRFLPGVGRLRA